MSEAPPNNLQIGGERRLMDDIIVGQPYYIKQTDRYTPVNGPEEVQIIYVSAQLIATCEKSAIFKLNYIKTGDHWNPADEGAFMQYLDVEINKPIGSNGIVVEVYDADNAGAPLTIYNSNDLSSNSQSVNGQSVNGQSVNGQSNPGTLSSYSSTGSENPMSGGRKRKTRRAKTKRRKSRRRN